jgi:hypothetical protein
MKFVQINAQVKRLRAESFLKLQKINTKKYYSTVQEKATQRMLDHCPIHHLRRDGRLVISLAADHTKWRENEKNLFSDVHHGDRVCWSS